MEGNGSEGNIQKTSIKLQEKGAEYVSEAIL